jgi:hypothetical protein
MKLTIQSVMLLMLQDNRGNGSVLMLQDNRGNGSVLSGQFNKYRFVL